MTVLDQEPRQLGTLIGEAGEMALAAEGGDRAAPIWEVADVLDHLAVVMVTNGVAAAKVDAEPARRAGGVDR